MRLNIVCGLPRSGSTLLSTILRQNPRAHAGISSALYPLLVNMADTLSPSQEFGAYIETAQRLGAMRGALAGYIKSTWSDRELIFDTNRHWGSCPQLITTIVPEVLFLVCVRDVGAVVDSFERLTLASPLHGILPTGGSITLGMLGRVDAMMGPGGVVRQPLTMTRSLLLGPFAARCLVIRYHSLVTQPGATLAAVYRFLGVEPFEHDFGQLPAADERDAIYDRWRAAATGLHRISSRVHTDSLGTEKRVIPDDVFAALNKESFWSVPGAIGTAEMV